MKIAVTYDNGNVFQHFGRTENFKVYDVEGNKVVKEEVVSTNGSGHGALAGILQNLKADKLICGGLGGGAQVALAELGIEVLAGVTGSCDKAVKEYLEGTLKFSREANCSHHEHEHGDEPHVCGEHGCGKHDNK